MSVKLLDIDYLRAQNTTTGELLVTTASDRVTTSNLLTITGNSVGIGSTAPTSNLSVTGNVAIFGNGAAYVFADGTRQTTASTATAPAGPDGAVQYQLGGVFGGSPNLLWEASSNRLGIGTTMPRSTLQIKDVGYESTNTATSGISEIVLDSFPAQDYRTCHYIVQVSDLNFSTFHSTQIMIIHDGLFAFKSEYNIVTTADKLGEFDCLISGGNVELTFTAFYTSDKNIKVIRTSIEP